MEIEKVMDVARCSGNRPSGNRWGALLLSVAILGLWTTVVPGLFANETGQASELYRFDKLTTSYRFAANGAGLQTIEAEITVLKPAAIQQLGQLYFPYSGDFSKIEVDFVRVLEAEGRVVEASEELFKDLAAPVAVTYPIYSDQRILHVTVPSFEVGDRIHYRVLVDFDRSDWMSHIGLLHRFQRHSTELETLRVDVPASVPVTYRAAEGLELVEETEEDRRLYTWKVRSDDLADANENDEPTTDIELSSASSWRSVGEWFRALAEGRTEPTKAIRRLAKERLEGVEDPRQKIAALHQLVTTEIRYLGLMFGSTRHQPRPAADVLDSGYGDCKDKHALLAALLGAAGFESSAVLVAASRSTPLDVPSALQFDHVITRVELPGEPLWLDSTTVAPPGYLSPQLRGKRGLLVPAQGEPRLVDLPKTLPYEQRWTFTARATVDELGTLRSETTARLRGDTEVLMRTLMINATPEQWLASASSTDLMLSRERFGEPAGPEYSDAMAINEPFEVRYSFTREAFLTGSGAVEIDVPLPSFGLADELSENRFDKLDLQAVPSTEMRLRLELPAGVEVEAPAPLTLDYENFAFRSEARVEPRGEEEGVVVEIVKSLSAKASELEPEAASEYKAFRRAVRKEESRKLLVRLEKEILAEAESLEGAKELRKAARKAITAGDSERAERLAQRLVETQPDDPYAWSFFGWVLAKVDKDQEALEARRKVLELDRFHDAGNYFLGLSLWRVGDEQEAIEAFRRQLSIDPLHTKTRAALGRLLGKHDGDCEEIVPLLTGHEESVHAYDWVLAYLGPCLDVLEQPEKAADVLEELRSRSDADVDAVEEAAYAFIDRSRCESALPLLRRLLELDPEHNMAHNSIGWCLHQAGDLDGAIAEYREQIRLDPAHDLASLNLSHLLYETQGPEPAAEVLEVYARVKPDDPTVQRALGVFYFYTSEPDRALEPLKKAHAADPDDIEVNGALGILFARQGQHRDALQYLEKAKALAPDTFEHQDMLDYVKGELEK